MHSGAVDGLEIVPHGDDMITGLAPLLTQFKGLVTVGVVAVQVGGNTVSTNADRFWAPPIKENKSN